MSRLSRSPTRLLSDHSAGRDGHRSGARFGRRSPTLWRSSKLIGLNVYNDQNEKLGDISEILLDKSGKVDGVVIGVGGFLGMGQHDIKVDMAKLKFVDEPVRTSATTTTTTTGAANRPVDDRGHHHHGRHDSKWYPDHAVLSGVSKDQLKSMPQFKFN